MRPGAGDRSGVISRLRAKTIACRTSRPARPPARPRPKDDERRVIHRHRALRRPPEATARRRARSAKRCRPATAWRGGGGRGRSRTSRDPESRPAAQPVATAAGLQPRRGVVRAADRPPTPSARVPPGGEALTMLIMVRTVDLAGRSGGAMVCPCLSSVHRCNQTK